MQHPYMLGCGHTFDSRTVTTLMQQPDERRCCPNCREPMSWRRVQRNYALAALVGQRLQQQARMGEAVEPSYADSIAAFRAGRSAAAAAAVPPGEAPFTLQLAWSDVGGLRQSLRVRPACTVKEVAQLLREKLLRDRVDVQPNDRITLTRGGNRLLGNSTLEALQVNANSQGLAFTLVRR